MEKKNTAKLHIILWMIILSFSVLSSFIYINNNIYVPILSRFILSFANDLISFYLFYFLLSQKFLSKKGIVIIGIADIAYIIVSGILFSFISFVVYKYFYTINVKPFEKSFADWFNIVIYDIIARDFIFSLLGCLAKISFIRYKNQVKQKETEKQNISIELSMLRAQVNPHFLFNTLNNIKSLIMSAPKQAVYSTGKLINITNYMLFESSHEKVSFKNEIAHIKNYLDLERIRFVDTEYIDLKISGDYSRIMIPPLIFMPFIENTFKHGDKLKQTPGILIKFDITDTNIFFEISNYIKENYVMHNKQSGFGLSNIKRRLELLFGNKYELLIKNENKIFTVKLNLNLI